MTNDKERSAAEDLGGRVALVTGAFGGIGRATVDALLARGACVARTFAQDREQAALSGRLTGIAPDRVSTHPLELASPASIEDCLTAVVARWGTIDILVNNAAVGSATVAAYADDQGAQDSALLTINIDGNLKVAQGFMRRLPNSDRATPAKLINVSSVGGGVAVFPGFRLADGMSKAAVAFMTRQLAAESVHQPVDVFAVCPGATDTPMLQASTLAKMSSSERELFLAKLPKGRLIDPTEIADVIAFLASQRSSVLHGAVIDASMGLGVRPGLMTEYQH